MTSNVKEWENEGGSTISSALLSHRDFFGNALDLDNIVACHHDNKLVEGTIISLTSNQVTVKIKDNTSNDTKITIPLIAMREMVRSFSKKFLNSTGEFVK